MRPTHQRGEPTVRFRYFFTGSVGRAVMCGQSGLVWCDLKIIVEGVCGRRSIMSMAITQKRRRLLIASTVVLLLVGGSWWLTRPKIDPRLVGVWTLTKPGTAPESTTEFCSDGTVRKSTPGVIECFSWNRWSCDGVTLTAGCGDTY